MEFESIIDTVRYFKNIDIVLYKNFKHKNKGE